MASHPREAEGEAMNDRELDRVISASERRVRSESNRLGGLQLRIRTARLQTSSAEDHSELLDPEIHRVLSEARAKIELAEHMAAARLGKAAA